MFIDWYFFDGWLFRNESSLANSMMSLRKTRKTDLSVKGLIAKWAQSELDGADGRLKAWVQGSKQIMGIMIMIMRAQVATMIMEWAIMVWSLNSLKYNDWSLDVVDNTMADPYANVFFSKDRTETIIEPVSSDEDSSGKDPLGILSRAEWMRGCPEGSELSTAWAGLELMKQTSRAFYFNISLISNLGVCSAQEVAGMNIPGTQRISSSYLSAS
jgi:hypothetical protein